MSGFTGMNNWEARPNQVISDDLHGFCRDYGCSVDDLLSRDRSQHLVELRVKAARRLRNKGYTLKRIGSMLGRSHSTIVHYLNEYKEPYERI